MPGVETVAQDDRCPTVPPAQWPGVAGESVLPGDSLPSDAPAGDSPTSRFVPHPLAIMALVLVAAVAASHLIPGGEFARITREGRTLVVAGSFHAVTSAPRGLSDALLAPFDGLMQASDIVFLLLLLGGTLEVVKESGALSAAVHRVARALRGYDLLLIPVLMAVFGLAGGAFGMYEEVLPFIGIVVPIAIALGYDSLVGVAIVIVSATLGFFGGFFNFFTVGIAQQIAGLPLFSGLGYRLVVWAALLALAIGYVVRYARRVKNDPRSSIVWQSDAALRLAFRNSLAAPPPFTWRHVGITAAVCAAFAFMPVGFLRYGWGVREITALFLALALVVGFLGATGANKLIASFVKGAEQMMTAALLVGFARAAKVLLDDSHVMDTILDSMSRSLAGLPPLATAEAMLGAHAGLNLLIQSGTAQAAVTMPLMLPLADVVGMSRQTATLAFQLGNTLTDLIMPWNGILLAALQLGGVPFAAWFRWTLWLQAFLLLLCSALLVWPVLSHWGPF